MDLLNYSANYIIALGSNLKFGNEGPADVVEQAFDELAREGLAIRAQSHFYNTAAFPTGAGPDFVNAAAVLECAFSPARVLACLHEVEARMGRERKQRWGARTLDLDLIAADQELLPDAETEQYWREMPLEVQKTAVPPELILPHPRLAERAFVLVPLMDVAPDWIHPATKLSVRQMHDALPQALRDEVVMR